MRVGAVIGANQVLGKVGVGGVPAIISIQKRILASLWHCHTAAVIIPFCNHFPIKMGKQEAKEIVDEPEAEKVSKL